MKTRASGVVPFSLPRHVTAVIATGLIRTADSSVASVVVSMTKK